MKLFAFASNIAFGIFAFLLTTAFTPAFGDLTFHVSGLDNSKGMVRVVLYDNQKNFLSENGFAAADSAFVNGKPAVEVVLHHVPFGTYAAAIYQDENKNGMIDQNLVQIPTEPYAFSNGVRAKWSVPSFNEVAFRFEQTNAQFDVQLRDWSKQ